MKKIYWVAAAAGTILTPLSIEMAKEQRGYSAIGGEFFVMPLCLLVALLAHQMCELVAVTIRYTDIEDEESQ